MLISMSDPLGSAPWMSLVPKTSHSLVTFLGHMTRTLLCDPKWTLVKALSISDILIILRLF